MWLDLDRCCQLMRTCSCSDIQPSIANLHRLAMIKRNHIFKAKTLSYCCSCWGSHNLLVFR